MLLSVFVEEEWYVAQFCSGRVVRSGTLATEVDVTKSSQFFHSDSWGVILFVNFVLLFEHAERLQRRCKTESIVL